MIQFFERNYNINPNEYIAITKLDNLRKEVQEYKNKYNKKLEYKNKYLCLISNNDNYGSGFFAKIPYKSKILKVLITNNNIIMDKNKIEIYLNYENEKKIIYLDNQRKKYLNKELNLFIIEIKESDKIKYFLKLDREIKNYCNSNNSQDNLINYFNELYKDNLIFTLNYKDKNNTFISFETLSTINENGIELTNKMSEVSFINENFVCTPILLLKNNKLIGFYNGGQSNNGKLITLPIIEFNKISEIITEQQESPGKDEIQKNINMINECKEKEQDKNENKKKEIKNNLNDNQNNLKVNQININENPNKINESQNNFNENQNTFNSNIGNFNVYQNNFMMMNNNLNNIGLNNCNNMMGMNNNQFMLNNNNIGMNNEEFMMNMMGVNNNMMSMNNYNMMGMNNNMIGINNNLMMNNMIGNGNQFNMNYNNINYNNINYNNMNYNNMNYNNNMNYLNNFYMNNQMNNFGMNKNNMMENQ